MTAQESNLQRHLREMREGGERLDAEQAKDPQRAAMAKAAKRTKDEQAAIDAAQAAVDEAEAAVNAAGTTLARAKRGQEALKSAGIRPGRFRQARPTTDLRRQ